jgi:hypothetical protein
VNGTKMGKPHKRETFFCSKCAKRFSGSGDLEKHERTHNLHEKRTHTGEKHSSAPNVTIASLHQITERVIKVLLQ